MVLRGHGPYEGRAIQAPGMMRHRPLPTGLAHSSEPLPPPHERLLENKISTQAAEIERLLRENQRLAATNGTMRQEVGTHQQEIERLKSHIGSIQTESGIQVRGLLEKVKKMENDIRGGEIVRIELKQAHEEAQNLVKTRMELIAEIKLLSEDLHEVGINGERMPELVVKLEGLRQEHQKLRAAFEREKGTDIEQVEQMRAMERNLISMSKEIEKLRADVMKAERGEHAMNPYAGGPYANPAPLYPTPAGHGVGYGHGYPNAGPYAHGNPAGYAQPYGVPQPQVPGFTDGYAREGSIP